MSKKQTIRQKHWQRFDFEIRKIKMNTFKKLGIDVKIKNKVNNEEGD